MLLLNSPFISLFLLFCTYAITGWRLADYPEFLSSWWLIVILMVLTNVVVTNPFPVNNNQIVSKWLQSDTQTLVSFIALTLIGIGLILLAWIFLFIQALLLLSVGILVGLDLRAMGFGKVKCFLILNMSGLGAYSLAFFGHQLIERV